DFKFSCISPRLSHQVKVVGVVHSDDPEHYEHVFRLGAYWDAIVVVSETIGERIASERVDLAPRLHRIPYGVHVPKQLPERTLDAADPLKIVYVGRLVSHQKRILDIPQIFRGLVNANVPVKLTLVGGGSEEAALRQAFREIPGGEQV